MSIKKIVLGTNIKGLRKKLRKAVKGIPIKICEIPPFGKPAEHPEILHVFVFSDCSEDMLNFMAANAGSSPNIVALLCRPDHGFLSTDNTLGGITLLSRQTIATSAKQKTLEALGIFK